jgi:hypothetical protein
MEDETIFMMQWSAVSEKPAPSWSEGNLLISSKH